MRRGPHVPEERIVARLLGDLDPVSSDSVDAHMVACADCRRDLSELRMTLELADAQPVPSRDASYGAAVWRRIEGRLASPRVSAGDFGATWLSRPALRGWALAATFVIMLLAAFLAGRHWPSPMQPIPSQARERALRAAVGDHLERAELLLVELVNEKTADGDTRDGGADPGDLRARRKAEELVADNRLYRQTAAGSRDNATAAVLDELERVLLDIAHQPLQVDDAERARIREILFKLKVIGTQIRGRENTASPGRNRI